MREEFLRNFKHTDKNGVGYFPAHRTEEVADWFLQKLEEREQGLVKMIESRLCEECECVKPVLDMNRCMNCRKVGTNKRTANEVLKEIIALINNK